MLPYLISITSYVPGVENYLRTIPNLRGTAEPLVFSYNPQVPNGNGYTVFRTESPYRGNLLRFADFPMDLDQDRMVVFTDTADVIFQGVLPPLDNKIYVTPENVNFDSHSWFHQYFESYGFHDLDNKPIFNMGTWAMPVKKAYELVAFLYRNQDKFDMWWGADQPLFNLWLLSQEYEVHPTLMGCLYNGIWSGDIVKTEGKFYNKDGQLLSIAHANGNTKPMLGEMTPDD